MLRVIISEHVQVDNSLGLYINDYRGTPILVFIDAYRLYSGAFDAVLASVAGMIGECPLRLTQDLLDGIAVRNSDVAIAAWSGGTGPLAEAGLTTFEEFKAAERQWDADRARKAERRAKLPVLRNEYVRDRPRLLSAMLSAGLEYCCAHPGCEQRLRLTIDHKVPLAKGGTNSLDNLQFMCQPHNSSKGDRI